MKKKLIALISLVVLLIAIILHVGLAPHYKIQELNQIVEQDSIYTTNYNPAYDNPEVFELAKEKVYKESLLKLSESDSIGLIVNLRDSLIGLSMKGVVIHQTKISNFQTDAILTNLSKKAYLKLFEKPLTVQKEQSSIIKEPVIIKEAPTDPAQAALETYVPDTVMQQSGYVIFDVNYGIRLAFKANQQSQSGGVSKMLDSIKEAASDFTSWLGHFTHFKRQEYIPHLEIDMPMNELQSIYRALPKVPSVVVIY